jgi:hypothetical protein
MKRTLTEAMGSLFFILGLFGLFWELGFLLISLMGVIMVMLSIFIRRKLDRSTFLWIVPHLVLFIASSSWIWLILDCIEIEGSFPSCEAVGWEGRIVINLFLVFGGSTLIYLVQLLGWSVRRPLKKRIQELEN